MHHIPLPLPIPLLPRLLLPPPPPLSLYHSLSRQLSEVLECILTVGASTGRLSSAIKAVQQLRRQLHFLAASVARSPSPPSPPRVLFLSSFSPLQAGGLWIPEMVQLAGGQDSSLVDTGCLVKTIPWEAIISFAPQVLLLSCCGKSLQEAAQQVRWC